VVATLTEISPEILLVLVATLLYVAATWVQARTASFWLALASLMVAAGLTAGLTVAAQTDETWRFGIFDDAFAHVLRWLTLFSGLLIVCLGWERRHSPMAGEYYGSLLIVVAGLSLVASSSNLVLLFVSLELISVPTYLLLYLGRRDARAREAAAKYFYLSILASALFLFGAALIYGVTGTTNLNEMRAFLQQPERLQDHVPVFGPLGLLLLLAGLAYKMAAVPFHFYAPDVYEGTTNVIAALLSWFPKAAGFVAGLRLIVWALEPALADDAAWIIWVFAVVTMTLGNTLALLQTNVRRLLAYSSIAHSGYILLGLGAACVGAPPGAIFTGTESVLVYLTAYLAMTVGLFAVIVWLSEGARIESIDDFAGLGRRHPFAAACAALFLFSLTGLPFTMGFWGKLAVFYSAIATQDNRYIVAAVIGVINAAIGAYYYMRIVALMYLRESYTDRRLQYTSPVFVAVLLCCLATLVGGVWPGSVVGWQRTAADGIEPRMAAPVAQSDSSRARPLETVRDEGSPSAGAHLVRHTNRAVPLHGN